MNRTQRVVLCVYTSTHVLKLRVRQVDPLVRRLQEPRPPHAHQIVDVHSQ